MKLNQTTFEKLISTTPDTENTTEEKVVLIYDHNGYALFVSTKDLNDFEPEIEEMCRVSSQKGYVSYELSDEQIEQLREPLKTCYESFLEGVEDAKEYNRDIYAYHGVSRSDFI